MGKANKRRPKKAQQKPHARERLSLAPLSLTQALKAVMETGSHPKEASRPLPKK